MGYNHHEHYIRQCFFLARKGIGSVSPNPPVGAVLVYQDRIIGSGFHRAYGQKHAEVEAVESVQERDKNFIPNSTLYISLEPCCHIGKTPACTELILREGIKRVVFSCADPNPIMSGKSVIFLKSQGIDVNWPILESEGMELIKPYSINILHSRPYVILKYAQSADYFLGRYGESTKISNHYADQWVHKWRGEVDGIAIGRATLQVDNPRLSTRHWPGKNPTRILLADLPEKEKPAYQFFNAEAKSMCLSDFHKGPSDDIASILQSLWDQKIGLVLVEGGAKTLKRFSDAGLWDEARIITNKKLNLGKGIPSPCLVGKSIFQLELVENTIQIIKRQAI